MTDSTALPDVQDHHNEFGDLLSQMVQSQFPPADGDDPCWAVAARQRTRASHGHLADSLAEAAAPDFAEPPARFGVHEFLPFPPRSFREALLSEPQVESLVLKFLLNRGTASGREIADQIALPFGLMEKFLHYLKAERLVVFKGSAPVADYQYELTDRGVDRGRRYSEQCTYFGVAPVALESYIASVRAQAISRSKPRRKDLEQAFEDLVIGPEMFSQLGRAASAGKGLFLYGSPGNGKSSIAQRITQAYGRCIWIPRAISAWGEIIRLYDPSNHVAAPPGPGEPGNDPQEVDRRWVRIRRPTIIAGGELTLDNLEVRFDPTTRIGEAPLQLKSNCGTLVIDDFGRQRISPADLLNRWIVPLEMRFDYLNVASGRKIQVPFEQLVVFSTNLEPRDLVDEAFLRRIPYKISVADPSESQFRELFERLAAQLGMAFRPDVFAHLLDKHYHSQGRAIRFCHARDLLDQLYHYCTFHELPLEMTREAIDAGAADYFAILQ